jgi:hypothetical protein
MQTPPVQRSTPSEEVVERSAGGDGAEDEKTYIQTSLREEVAVA